MLLLKIITIKNLFFTTLTGVTLLLNSAVVAQISQVQSSASSRILQEANVSKKMNWGIRTASPPFSFEDTHKHLQGVCTDLVSLLDKYLKENKFVTKQMMLI
ncbi:hypothetical protein [Nostoc sp.]|uniref:hypothetical protein n=1 Tax=Nostoc sp. TaxID=1180 RepID=UPI002FF9D7B4